MNLSGDPLSTANLFSVFRDMKQSSEARN